MLSACKYSGYVYVCTQQCFENINFRKVFYAPCALEDKVGSWIEATIHILNLLHIGIEVKILDIYLNF